MSELLLRRLRVRFERPVLQLDGLGRVLAEGIGRLEKLPAGRVAVVAGSRGVAGIAGITREIVRVIKGMGLEVFIVPAMGSHGGGTAEGQVKVLGSLGITAEAMGCEIRASMEVVNIGRVGGAGAGAGHEIYMDKHAWEADRVLLVNRIKPHTDFHGRYESGLAKMAVIGLGKKVQAEIMHGFGVRGLRDLVPVAAERVFATGKIWGGVGIVENAYDETAEVAVLRAEEIMEKEPGLLEKARRNMPRLAVEDVDVLIIDEMGKNISGTGMDTGIIGRMRIRGEPEPERPRVGAIAVLGLTGESFGNGIGVGLADVITEKLWKAMDWEATRTNVVTAGFFERVRMPVAMRTDAEAAAVALRIAGKEDWSAARVMRIRSTLHLEEVMVSVAVAKELEGRGDVEFIGGWEKAFAKSGDIGGW